MAWFRFRAATGRGGKADFYRWYDHPVKEGYLEGVAREFAKGRFPSAECLYFEFARIKRPPQKVLAEMESQYEGRLIHDTRMLDRIRALIRK